MPAPSRPQTGFNPSDARSFWPWIALMVGMYAAMAYVYIFWGGFVGDEAFYTLAAENVLRGMRPYRDFLYPQMPLLPYVYAAWFSITGPSIESARILSAIFGAGSVALISLTCHRQGGRIAGIVGGLLVACSWHVVNDTSMVKTQALTVLLVSSALFVLAKRDSPRPTLRMGLAMLFMTLALFQRLSMLPALMLLWAFLGWQSRKSLSKFAGLLILNVAVVAGVFAYFYSDGNMLFGIYRVHHEYWGNWPWSFAMLRNTIRSWIGNQLPIVLLFFCAIWLFLGEAIKKRRLQELSDDFLFCAFLLLSYWSYTLLHWNAVQNYATHHTSVTPFAVAFAMTVLAPKLDMLAKDGRAFWGFALAALLCLPLPFGEGGGLPAFNGNGGSQKIREVLSIIKPYAKPGDTLLTFNAELAVNGGYALPAGYDMCEYSIYPTMTEEECAKYRVIHPRRLISDITSGKNTVLCLGDREFGMMAGGSKNSAEELMKLINLYYRQVGQVANYGQFSQNYYIFVRK